MVQVLIWERVPGLIITPERKVGMLWNTDFQNVKSITLVLKNRKTGNIKKKECVNAGIEAHTYNKFPDGKK